jgi:iron complex outermembrane receptor protein
MQIKLLTATSLVALSLAATGARAQTMDYGALEQLFGEPVTTSATGSPQKATEVPADMEIITAEDIRRSGAVDIPGVLKHVAGVDVEQWGTDNSDVGVRGYDQPFSPRLLVLIDGRQVYADYYGYTPWSALPVELGAIRQIEVVKGPNSALFGFNAVGGVINIITYNPLYDDVNTVSLTGGTQGFAKGSAVGTVKLGDVGGLRISLGGHSDSDFSTPLEAGSVGSRRGDDNGSIDLDGVFRLSDKVQLTVEASHTRADYPEAQPETALLDYDKYTTSSLRGQVNADTEYGALQASLYSNWIKYIPYSGAATNPVLTANNNVTVLQLQDTFKVGTDSTLRASAEYRHNTIVDGPAETASTFYDVVSAGLMWDWKIAPTVSLTNALRLDHLMLGRSGTEPAGFPLANSAWDQSLTEPSFNSGLVWQEDDLDTFRLTAARGVQVPSLLDYGGLSYPLGGKLFITGLPTNAPAIVMNYEASWDRAVAPLGGKLHASVFYQTNDNLAGPESPFTPLNGALIVPYGADVGNSEAVGLELSFKGTFLTDWRWGLSYTPEMITDHLLPGQGIAISGVDFQHTEPNHIVKANLGWAHGPWEIDSFAQYKSSFYGVIPGPAAAAGAFGSGQLTPISDYVAFDGRVAYKVTDWATLALSAQNLSQSTQKQTAGSNVERQVFGSVTINF